MNIQDIFNQFCADLKNRRGIMTEDNIRYYWFAAMLKQDDDLNHYTLEYPYLKLTPGILQNEELDLLYNNNSTDYFCFEMKFHRNATQASSSAKTSAAGDLFNDLQRLQQIAKPEARRFFLYVTDPIMYDYLSKNDDNRKDLDYSKLLMNFCALKVARSKKLDFINAPKTPSTFRNRANKSLNTNKLPVIQKLLLLHKDKFSCNSSSFANNNNNTNCHVRLYEVL